MYELIKRTVKDDVMLKDNVTIDVIDVEAIARFYKISKARVDKLILNGFDPSVVPGAVTRQTVHNIITNGGLDLIVKRLKDSDSTTTRLTHFAVGTSNTTPTVNDTVLGAEAYRDAITQYVYTSVGVITLKGYIPTAYPTTQPVTLKEAGLFNASYSGTLFARVLFSPEITKNNTISIVISWEVHAT